MIDRQRAWVLNMDGTAKVDNDGEAAALASIAPTITAHPEKQLVYSSPQIQERRERILREARKLITEEGIEAFSIRKLCVRAGVVQRTLYNAFHSKDRIIALAIWHTYEEAHRKARYGTAYDTVEGVIDRVYSVNRRNLRSPNYAKAIVALYFAQGLGDDILKALRAMVYFQRLWLERVQQEGMLRPRVDLDNVLNDLANLEYSTIHDWVQGRLAGEAYLTRILHAFLIYAYAITTGQEHERIGRLVDRLEELDNAEAFHKEIVAGSASGDMTQRPPAR